jgi:tripartite-type tricarboxylate transporter receptor subunit TctC
MLDPQTRATASRRDFLLGASLLGLSCLAGGRAFAGGKTSLDGRRISFVIGNEGSGGYETYARAIAGQLAAALPEASLTVEMMPEADGRLAAKRIAEAPAGEMVIGLFETALLYSEIETDDLAPITLTEFNWIGKLAVDERVLIASTKSGITSIGDLRARKDAAIFPASTVASRSASECYVLNALLDLPIRPVPGYNGAQRALAMLSGEAQVVLGSYTSQLKLIDQNAAVVILRLNEVPHPQAPLTAPLLRDLAGEANRPLVELAETAANLGRWIAAPPSASAEEVADLRAAFDRAVASPEFTDEIKKARLTVDPLGGAEVQARVAAILAKKTALRASLAAAVACGRERATGAKAC